MQEHTVNVSCGAKLDNFAALLTRRRFTALSSDVWSCVKKPRIANVRGSSRVLNSIPLLSINEGKLCCENKKEIPKNARVKECRVNYAAPSSKGESGA